MRPRRAGFRFTLGITRGFKNVAGVWLVWSLCSGSRSDRRCNAALGHSLGSWSWESNRTGQETEVIVKEKCKELIQCQKT